MHWLGLAAFGIVLWALSRKGDSSPSSSGSAPSVPRELSPLESPEIAPPPLEDMGDPLEPSPLDDATKKDIDGLVNQDKASLPKILRSPFEGISDGAWTRYVQSQKGGRLNTVSKTNNLGLFFLGMRVLQDLGYAQNVKLRPFPQAGAGKQAYQGDFAPPLTQEEFLSNAKLQYEAFRRMTERDAKKILADNPNTFKDPNLVIDGLRPTLSGFLAVLKRTGPVGFQAWLKGDRKPETTAEYKKANNIF